MADSLKNQLSSLFTLRSGRKAHYRKRKHPIVRDEQGLSARARAFESFDKGLRPSQLPDLGVTRATLYRYFESWKRRNDDLVSRYLSRAVRETPELRQHIAVETGLAFEEVSEAFSHRNAFAALNRYIRNYLIESLGVIGRATPAQIDRLGRLISAYRGRDRRRYLIRFSQWCENVLQSTATSEGMHVAVLDALMRNEDALMEFGDLMQDISQFILETNRRGRVMPRSKGASQDLIEDVARALSQKQTRDSRRSGGGDARAEIVAELLKMLRHW